MNNETVKIVIADDHVMFAEGLKSLLQQNEKYEVLEVYSDGQALLNDIKNKALDVLLLDINMPVLDGISTLKELRAKYPDLKVIMLSTHASEEFLRSIFGLNINGYISKNVGKEVLYEAIDTVLAGQIFFSADVEEIAKKVQKTAANSKKTLVLSNREMEVLRALGQGKTYNEAADTLHISAFTIEAHKKNIMFKLNLHSMAEMIKYATERGMI